MSIDIELVPTPRLPEPVFTIQEWIAQRMIPTPESKPLRYAKWWMSKQLERVSDQIKFLDFDGGHQLYVTLRKSRYRVTAVSRQGILSMRALAFDGRPVVGVSPVVYYPMINDAEFSEWSNTEAGPLDDSKFVPYVSTFPFGVP